MVTWLLRSLLVLLVLVLLAVGVVAFVEPRIDLSAQRGWVGARLSALTGQPVRITGDVLLSVGRHAHLAVTGLQVEAPPSALPGLQVEAEEAALGIDVVALFGGVMRFEGAALRDARIRFEPDTVDGPRADPTDSRKPFGGYKVILADLAARNVALTYARPDRPAIEVAIGHLDQRGEPSGMLAISSRGRVNDLPVALEGRIGTLSALMTARDVAVDLDARLGDTAVAVRGTLGQPGRLEDLSLTATARGPSLSALLSALHVPHEHGGDVDLSVQITDRDQGLSWRSSGRFGPLSLDTHGVLEQPLALEGLHVTAWFSGEDLDAVGRVFGTNGLPAEPFRLTAEMRRQQGELTVRNALLEAGPTRAELAARLPRFPDIAGSAVSLDLTTPEPGSFATALGLPALPPGPLRVQLTLSPADADTSRIEARADLGANGLAVSGALGRQPGYPGTALEVELSGPSLADLAQAPLPDRPYRLAGRVFSTDDGRLSLRSSDGSLGSARLSVDGSLGHPPALADSNLGLSMEGPSLDETLGGLFGHTLPDQAFRLQARLLGDVRRPALGNLVLRTDDLSLDTTGKLGLPPRLDGTDLRFLLQLGGPARLVRRAAAVPRGPMRLSGAVRAEPEGLALEDLLLQGERFTLTGRARLPELPRSGRGEARVEFAGAAGSGEWSGQGLARWTDGSVEVSALQADLGDGQLTGTASVTRGAGERLRIAVQALAQDLDLESLFAALPEPGGDGTFVSQLLDALDPGATEETRAVVECTAAAGEISAGRLLLSPGALVRTDRVDILATGFVDPSQREIDVVARTVAREDAGRGAPGIVESFTRIGGALDDPKLESAPSRAALAAPAAGTTSGLSLLATEPGPPTPTPANPCQAVLAAAGRLADGGIPQAGPNLPDLDLLPPTTPGQAFSPPR